MHLLKTRRGFTLIELIIVIFLILLVYMIVFSYFTTEEKKPQALSPLTLKNSLKEAGLLNDHTTLLCTDQCTRCYLRNGTQSPFKKYEGELNLQDTEVYTLDDREDLQLLEYGRYRDRKICLRLDFYPNGSSTKAILKTPQGVYLLPAFFGEPIEFQTIEEAKEYWLKDTRIAKDEGEYY